MCITKVEQLSKSCSGTFLLDFYPFWENNESCWWFWGEFWWMFEVQMAWYSILESSLTSSLCCYVGIIGRVLSWDLDNLSWISEATNWGNYRETSISIARAPRNRFCCFWSSLSVFESVWVVLNRFKWFWTGMSVFEPVWVVLNRYEWFWTGLSGFEPVWVVLNRFETFWIGLSGFGPVWVNLNRFECFWISFLFLNRFSHL
jgi:hypothetical protein